LIKLEAEFHTLLVTTHHIVCDGWSTNVLLNELAQLYASQASGEVCHLSAPMPFREYAERKTSGSKRSIAKPWKRGGCKSFRNPSRPSSCPRIDRGAR